MSFYSDNGVDEFVAPLLPEFGYAVEVGANDGVVRSNTKHFEDKGWIVLCIEPNPYLAESGKANRKLWRQIACGAKTQYNAPFAIIGEYPYAALSGFHSDQGPDYSTSLSSQIITVRMEPLNRVLECSGFPRLDYLTIDAEGHEMDIMQGMDFFRWKPIVVVVEGWTEQRNAEIDAFLVSRGYCFQIAQAYDRIYKLR